VTVALGSVKLLKLVRARSRNDTSHRGYWNSVAIGFMNGIVKEGYIPED